MPYVNRKDRNSDIRILLRGNFKSGDGLSEILNCCGNTARAKLDDPDRLTIGDLRKICNKGHIEESVIKNALHLWR